MPLRAEHGTPHAASQPQRLARRSFGAASGLTLVSTVVPGLGLVGTRWRVFGVVLTVLAVILAGLAVVGATVARGWAMALVADPTWLMVAAFVLMGFGLAWIIGIIGTQLLTRPRPAPWWQRVVGALLVAVCTFAVAAPSAFGARTLLDTSALLRDVFQDPGDPGGANLPSFGNAADPWANKPRLNLLILGSDAGDDRTGTRTDTVMVASIDTKTGETVLFGLPRQTERLVFPSDSPLAKIWPNGFHLDGQPVGEQMLNAMYENVVSYPGVKQMLPPAKDPGAKVLQMAVGASLGLDIDYYVMANLNGFVEVVNAVGGVTVNINKPLPVGGKNPSGSSPGFPPDRWLPPGPNQHLNGYDALWFARGRYMTDDYDRMSRQRCVVKALTQQVNLGTVLANYEALTAAGRDVISTDVPNRIVPALIDLAGKVRQAPVRTVSFADSVDGFSTANPKWPAVRQRVAAAIQPGPAPAPAPTTSGTAGSPTARGTAHTPTPSSRTTASAPGTVTPSATASAPVDECAYHPVA